MSLWCCVHTMDVNGAQCCSVTGALKNICFCVLKKVIRMQTGVRVSIYFNYRPNYYFKWFLYDFIDTRTFV